MKMLIVRADDLGLSPAVNTGIAQAVAAGTVDCVEVMVNMSWAEEGIALLGSSDVYLDLHATVSCGTPVADPSSMRSLVDDGGRFLPSAAYRTATAQGRDLVVFDDAVTEVEAQVDRFEELVGRPPSGISAHAVASPTFDAALEEVGRSRKIPVFTMPSPGDPARVGARELWLLPLYGCEGVDTMEGLFAAWERDLARLEPGKSYLSINHPGWVDEALLETSSLVEARCRDAALLASDRFKGMVTRLRQEGCRRLI